MSLVHSERYQKAIEHLQYLPQKQQMVVFDLIENFFEIIGKNQTEFDLKNEQWQKWQQENKSFLENLGLDIREPSEQQKSFLMWRVNYEKALAKNDDWTDDESDSYWASLRDKNDTGREVSFE
ncbi:Uncharacterised protein [Moraxella lacunata]|uniref:Uncharacterized protein n=1 Tax=Moraxella lacunata TaxID=477 RepID=A0A378T6A9_MORLA|nr:hypothetical protein [Moraxella lacunata]STZ56361.1 Uncharacterised protein [Moraxella lacunata]